MLTDHQVAYNDLLRGLPQPKRFDDATALRIIGRRDDIHPVDVATFLHETRNQALLVARANREAYGHPTLAAAVNVKGQGWIHVIDLRPTLTEDGIAPHDPALPDDHRSLT